MRKGNGHALRRNGLCVQRLQQLLASTESVNGALGGGGAELVLASLTTNWCSPLVGYVLYGCVLELS